MGRNNGAHSPNAFIRWIDWVDRPAKPGHEDHDFLAKFGSAIAIAGGAIALTIGVLKLGDDLSSAPRPEGPPSLQEPAHETSALQAGQLIVATEVLKFND